MLCVIMLDVTYKPFVLSVVRLNIVMLSVVVPSCGLCYKTYYGRNLLLPLSTI